MLVRTRIPSARRRSQAAALALTLAALGLGAAHAATLTVNSVGDTPDAVGNDGVCGATGVPNSCTLRAAIQEANANADSANAIDLGGVSGQINVATALPNITKAVAITGPSGRVTVSGGDVASLFRFVCPTAPCPAGGNYSISNLIVTNGLTTSSSGGGGIYFGAVGTVNFTLTNVDVTSSTADGGPGGGIAAVLVSNGSTLTLTNVDIGAAGLTGGNEATGDGGGLWVRVDANTATMTLENASIVNNSTDGNGGGIAVARGRLNVYESTVSANLADGSGGGIYLGKTVASGGSARIENVTISGNTAASGGGVGAAADNPAASAMTFTTITGNTGGGIAVATDPEVTFPGSSSSLPFTGNIVAGNAGAECAAAFSHTDAANSGYNLTDEAAGSSSCGFAVGSNDRFATTAAQLGLDGLANNPSAPQTHALLAGSLAIDAGNPNWDTGSDQRGATTQDGGADGAPGDGTPVRDIGAYEFGGFGLVQLSLQNFQVGEDTTPALVTIKRYGTGTATTTTPTVEFSSTAGTATEGTCGGLGSPSPDYTAESATSFTFAASGATQFTQTASFAICPDEDVEGDETFDVALAEPGTDNAGYDLGPLAEGTVAIEDVENGVFAFATGQTLAAAEGNAGSSGSVTLTITRTSGSDGAVRVNYSTTSSCSTACTATAGTDYTSVTSFVDFADGQTSRTITLNFVGDAGYEANETFEVQLDSASCTGLAAGQGCDARLSETANDRARLTITNDDAPSTGQFQFELSSYAVDETGTLTVKVKRVGGSDGAVSVKVEGKSGTAAVGSQFNVTSPVDGTLSWSAGDSADKTVTVTPVNDPATESVKHFTLELNTPATSTSGLPVPTIGGTNPVSVTLTSDEQPAFQFEFPTDELGMPIAYSIDEANANVTLTVSWDAFTGEDVTVDYFTLDVTAVSPVDYTGIPQASAGTITAQGGGATSTTFQVAVKADSAAEGNETFNTALATPVGGGELGTNTPVTVTIVDPAGVRFTSASFTRADEQSGGTITASVERFGDLSQEFSVDFEIGECAGAACATQGDDFYRLAGTTGTLSWDADEGGTKTFTVNVQADTLIEGDETFNLALSNPQEGAGPSSPGALGLAAASAIIPDDDYRFQITDVSPLTVGESGTKATVTVQRVGSTRGAASVQYGTANGTATAGSDFTAPAPASAVSWATGVGGTKTFDVAITSDAVDELDETFTVALSNASTNLSGEASAISGSPLTVSIADDDTSVVSIASGSATEAADVTMALSLSTPSDRSVTVTYNTADGTATAASDYTAVSNGQVTFAAGETSKNVAIATLGDARNEADETFTVALSAPTNGAQVSGTAGTGTGTVVDDDPVPSLSVADAAVTEGNADVTLTFVVSLSAASGRTVTVNVATADVTAAAPGDYTAVPSTPVTFAPGDISKNVAVTVKGDAIDEAEETLALALSAAVNATIGDASATGTITDDDAAPVVTLSASAPSMPETDGTATITATLSNPSSQAVTVTLGFAGMALNPNDYTASAASITVPAGATTGSILLTSVGDGANEPDETVIVDITGVTNGTESGTQTQTVEIIDDDKGGGGGSWSWLSLWLLLPAFLRRRGAMAA